MRKEDIHREGKVEEEKVEVDSTRVSIGGDGREGEGGRDGDRTMGEEEGRRGETLSSESDCEDGCAKGLSDVASWSASSMGMTTVVVCTAVVFSPAAVDGDGDCGGCGGWGVVVPEGMANGMGDGWSLLCQYIGSS